MRMRSVQRGVRMMAGAVAQFGDVLASWCLQEAAARAQDTILTPRGTPAATPAARPYELGASTTFTFTVLSSLRLSMSLW